MRSAAAGIAVCACLAWSCNRVREAPAAVAATSTPAAAPATGVPHGDHNPRHGGVVFMDGDLHFEVVLGRDGQHRLYFSDAMREELPAATASAVTVTVAPKAGPPDAVALQIDDSGESWVGRGHQVSDPEAIARVAYIVRGRPYFIDVPFPR
jgi:hypothetical protein